MHKYFKIHQKFSRLFEPTKWVNYSLYLQQAGEDEATDLFPKPEHQMTVGHLAKLVATFQWP
jgi:hypothetical protein